MKNYESSPSSRETRALRSSGSSRTGKMLPPHNRVQLLWSPKLGTGTPLLEMSSVSAKCCKRQMAERSTRRLWNATGSGTTAPCTTVPLPLRARSSKLAVFTVHRPAPTAAASGGFVTQRQTAGSPFGNCALWFGLMANLSLPNSTLAPGGARGRHRVKYRRSWGESGFLAPPPFRPTGFRRPACWTRESFRTFTGWAYPPLRISSFLQATQHGLHCAGSFSRQLVPPPPLLLGPLLPRLKYQFWFARHQVVQVARDVRRRMAQVLKFGVDGLAAPLQAGSLKVLEPVRRDQYLVGASLRLRRVEQLRHAHKCSR